MQEKPYRKSDSIVYRKIGQNFILVPIRQDVADLESVYTLDEVSARIWELIDGGTTSLQVRDALVAEYEVTLEQAEADLAEFLNQLEQIGAVSLVDSGENAFGPQICH